MRSGKTVRYMAILALLAGCSDDAGSTTSGGNSGVVCGDTYCALGEVCYEGNCAVEANLGELCDGETIICREGECVVGTCEIVDKKSPIGGACEATSDCVAGVCINQVCSKQAMPGEACESDEICAVGKCIGGVCTMKSPIGGSCAETSDCQDGVCVANVCEKADGRECVPELNTNDICGKAAWCTPEGACEPRKNIEESCTMDYECLTEVCMDMSYCVAFNIGLGEACDQYRRCASGTTCEADGRCHEKVSMPGAACDAYRNCSQEGYACIDGACTKTYGECTDSRHCAQDSYCCLEESCGAPNTCVPYKDGQTDAACRYETVPGLFEAAIQCEWKAPAAGDAYPNHANVLMTPIVVKTPHEQSGTAQSVIFTTYNCNDGGSPSGQGSDYNCNGVIRIINGETCALMESIYDPNNHVIGGSNLAAADVDGDGYVEIFASRGSSQKAGGESGYVSFHWDTAQKKYVTWKSSAGTNGGWGGPALHDINNDGVPELVARRGEVFNAVTMERIGGGNAEDSIVPAVGDFDNDGNIEYVGITHVYRWNNTNKTWETPAEYKTRVGTGYHMAYADFGTRNADGTFDLDKLDGIAEVAACGNDIVQISTLQGEIILRKIGLKGGGPCTIGDFDGDTLPEIATAFGDAYRIFDPRCKSAADGCADTYVLWSKYSQDASSSSTGSSLFDFDGDGAMEAVYADECYTRVYDGKTGDVLFSAYRSSSTWHENPVIADVDNDDSAEIVVGSNNSMKCTSPDPIHRGLRCDVNSDCKSGVCVKPEGERLGLCRCTENSQCNSRTDMAGNILNEYACVDGLTAKDQAGGKVCRAVRSNAERVTGVRIMRDNLDRWMSSRNIWNQHAYSITNINDDMTIPKTVNWIMNFALGKGMNNFRQNVQGKSGANQAPDITGRFTGDVCQRGAENITLNAVICNRGTKMVASKMPATFYAVGADDTRTKLCTSYTSTNVPIGGCLPVSCEITSETRGDIVIVVNDDGNGGKTTVECNETNNEAYTSVDDCPIVVN